MSGRRNPLDRRTKPARFIPGVFLYGTLALSLAAMILLATEPVRSISIEHSPVLDGLVYWLDAMGLQVGLALVTTLATCVVVSRYMSIRLHSGSGGDSSVAAVLQAALKATWVRWLVSLALAAGIIVFLLLLQLWLERVWFKPSFMVPRPDPQQAVPTAPLTGFVETLLGIERGTPSDLQGGGAPSGYVMRQWWLFLALVVALEQIATSVHDHLERTWLRLVVYLPSFLSVLWVAFSRIYGYHHSVFDVGVSIGLGTYSFWLLLVLPSSVYRRDVEYLTELAGASFVFLLLFFFYSQSSHRWVVGGGLTFVALALVYVLAERGHTHRGRLRARRRTGRR